MKRELLFRVFSTLQTLERAVAENNRALQKFTGEPRLHATALEQQERLTNHMRRTANRLQFELACDNWREVVRLLQIFYGLHGMVRPEILKTGAALALGNEELSKTTPLPPAPSVMH